jgi:hypothetical protein
MKCEDSQNAMPLFLACELDGQSSADFERHIKICADCRKEINLQKNYDIFLRQAFAEETLETAALRERVRRQIGVSDKPRISLWKLPQMRFGFAFAALLIVLGIGLVYFVFKPNQPTIYAGVARDYTEDVIEQMPKQGWHDGETEAIEYARQQFGDEKVAAALAPEGYRLVRTRVCNPAGKLFVHLIYDNGERQISFYVRKKDDNLPGKPVEIINDRAFYAERIKTVEIAAFQSARFTVLLASDLPREESLRLAGKAVERLA